MLRMPAPPTADHPLLHGLALHNPCNLRRQNLVEWRGASLHQPSVEFLSFERPEYGIRAAARVLLAAHEARGITTLVGIVDHWARIHGRGGNVEDAILRHTGWRADWKPDLRDPAVMRGLLSALMQHELRTHHPYPTAVIDRAMHLAGLDVPGQPDHEEIAA